MVPDRSHGRTDGFSRTALLHGRTAARTHVCANAAGESMRVRVHVHVCRWGGSGRGRSGRLGAARCGACVLCERAGVRAGARVERVCVRVYRPGCLLLSAHVHSPVGTCACVRVCVQACPQRPALAKKKMHKKKWMAGTLYGGRAGMEGGRAGRGLRAVLRIEICII